LIKWNPRGLQTIVNMNFSIELCVVLFRELFISWYPDEFITRTQVKPRLVEGDDIMPCSITLDFEHSQYSPGQIDSIALLRI
jgi:hypothetical protein